MTKYKIKSREGVTTHQDGNILFPHVLFQTDLPIQIWGLYGTILSLNGKEANLSEYTPCEEEKKNITNYLELLSSPNNYTIKPFITIEENTIWIEDVYGE